MIVVVVIFFVYVNAITNVHLQTYLRRTPGFGAALYAFEGENTRTRCHNVKISRQGVGDKHDRARGMVSSFKLDQGSGGVRTTRIAQFITVGYMMVFKCSQLECCCPARRKSCVKGVCPKVLELEKGDESVTREACRYLNNIIIRRKSQSVRPTLPLSGNGLGERLAE